MILNFCLVCWYNNLTYKKMDMIEHIDKTAVKIIGNGKATVFNGNYNKAIDKILNKNINDDTNNLNVWFPLLRSIKARTDRYKFSFVPSAIRRHNDLYKRGTPS